MGLKNQPEFEQMNAGDTATATQPQTTDKEKTMTSTTTRADAAAASVAATTAIAKAGASAVGAATKFQVAFAEKNNVLDTPTVEGLSLAAPPIKGEQGSLFMTDKDLGAAIQFELISFNHRWAIGTGEDDKEAKDFFRVSYDNETISGNQGVTVKDYLESLKAQGFSKAKASPYMDLWGFVTWSEKNGPVPAEERQLCRLQASQTSMGAFVAFATTRGLLQSRGLVEAIDVIEVHAEKRTSGSNKFTNMSFFAPKEIK